jgi:hypothetical protein
VRKKTKEFTATVAAIAVALSVAMLASRPLTAAAQQANEPAIDGDDIGGVVSGPNGPEAGVWVIAESVDLPTKFAKIVVTDEQGRYVIPDLPAVNYSVWVRGYGLVDSPKMRAKPGEHVDLTAVPAPNAAAAAHYYPAIYWYSLLRVPAENELKGDSPPKRSRSAIEAGQFFAPDEEHRLHRLPSAWTGSYPHHSGAVRRV